MSTATPLLVLSEPWEQAIVQVNQRLAEVGLYTVRTFDLRDARQAHMDCTCPYHGTTPCDCQIVILLVYGDGQPLSLVAHGFEGQTWLSLVSTPQEIADRRLVKTVRATLTQPTNSS